MAKELDITKMVGVLIGVVVGVVLIPVIYTTIQDANISDASTTAILALIPFLFAVALLVAVVTGML